MAEVVNPETGETLATATVDLDDDEAVNTLCDVKYVWCPARASTVHMIRHVCVLPHPH